MAARRWTEAQRREAAKRARRTRPWRHSTGPRTLAGKAATRLNGLKHGARDKASRDLLSLLAATRAFRLQAMRRMRERELDLHRAQRSREIEPLFPACGTDVTGKSILMLC